MNSDELRSLADRLQAMADELNAIPGVRVTGFGIAQPEPDPLRPAYDGECGCSLYLLCEQHAASRPRGCRCHGPLFRSSLCPVQVRGPQGTGAHADEARLKPEQDPDA